MHIASAKGAQDLAADAPKIRVNAIAPLTDLAAKLLSTPEKVEASAKRHPLGRVGTAGDIASAAEFLLGENSGLQDSC
jgi:NAD(P)-dependent dehydrogenase (short-subunit alcohol dehydrogenase family)